MTTNHDNSKQMHWNYPLQADERIMWQGAPLPGVRDIPLRLLLSFVGIVLFIWAFALLTDKVPESLRDGRTFESGMFFFLAVFLLFVGSYYCFFQWREAARAHLTTRYVLSNQCAYIARHTSSRTLEAYPMLPETAVELDHRRGYDDLWLHVRKELDPDGDVTTKRIGFEGIADGAKVLALIREIQVEQIKRAKKAISHTDSQAETKTRDTTHPDFWS
jgi:hypothetical protein